jgi:predicted nucleic acid-binding protein
MSLTPPLPDTALLLDNDLFTPWRNQHPQVSQNIKEYVRRLKSFPKLAAITIFEARWGVEKEIAKDRGLNQDLTQCLVTIDQLVQCCEVLSFDQRAASIAAFIFGRLPKNQRNEHWQDVFVAATALANGYGVATKNRKDFELIGQHLPPHAPVLRLDVWTI